MNVNQKALDDLGVKPFDVADHFHDEEFMITYLKEILADGDAEELAEALCAIARYKGRLVALESEGLTQNSLAGKLSALSSRKSVVNRVLEVADVEFRLKPFVSGSTATGSHAPKMFHADVLVGKKGHVLRTIRRRKNTKKLA